MKGLIIVCLLVVGGVTVHKAKKDSNTSIEGLVIKAVKEQNKRMGRSPALSYNK